MSKEFKFVDTDKNKQFWNFAIEIKSHKYHKYTTLKEILNTTYPKKVIKSKYNYIIDCLNSNLEKIKNAEYICISSQNIYVRLKGNKEVFSLSYMQKGSHEGDAVSYFNPYILAKIIISSAIYSEYFEPILNNPNLDENTANYYINASKYRIMFKDAQPKNVLSILNFFKTRAVKYVIFTENCALTGAQKVQIQNFLNGQVITNDDKTSLCKVHYSDILSSDSGYMKRVKECLLDSAIDYQFLLNNNNSSFRNYRNYVDKVYLYRNSVNKEVVKNIFESIENRKDFQFLELISQSDESLREDVYKYEAEKTKKKEEELKRLKKCEHISRALTESLNMLKEMNTVFYKGVLFENKLKEMKSPEYSLWVNEYRGENIKNIVDKIYRKNKKNKDSSKEGAEKATRSILNLCKVCLGNEEIYKYMPEHKGDVNQYLDIVVKSKGYLPAYMSNDSLNYTVDFNKYEDFNKILKEVGSLLLDITLLFEVFLGVELAVYGKFMNRYGLNSMGIMKKVMYNLDILYNKETPMVCTENVLENANKATYLLMNKSISVEDFCNLSTEKMREELGDTFDCVKNYMLIMSDMESDLKKLEHTSVEGESKQLYLRIRNLYQVLDVVSTILTESCATFKIIVS